MQKDIIVDGEPKLWRISNVKLTAYCVTFECIIIQYANNTSFDSFYIQEVTGMKEFHVK